ncbi:transglycosylase SLT domain-containing protein [Rothia sp. P7208]|uniref:transglycosylase SLT domain-containing protein n=1 Tax=Rothia sp. P7208 TaxID=3402660 RepID=UPI003ACBEA75
MTAEKTSRSPFIVRIFSGLLAHWQVIASAGLLAGGVAGLAATYTDYCGETDLTYAPVVIHEDLKRASEESGIRTGFLAAQLETESHWRVEASSHAGAQGLAQFTPDTWEIWGQGDISNPHASVRAQGKYLAYLKERLAPLAKTPQELQDFVFAGYNAGPGAVEEYRGVPPYGETQNYVKSINKLASSKYKVTCDPDPHYSVEKLKYRQ